MLEPEMRDSQYVVIVGCGRVGSLLANSLSRDGHLVVVIDRKESTFERLSPDFSGFRIEGDATQLSVLREARLSGAATCIVTTHEDNVNLMVAQVAQKVFSVPNVLARVFDPRREQVYSRLGVRTICPTTAAIEMFLQALAGANTPRTGDMA
jgi:trk system potassium uptake protein TrkA